MSLSLSDFRPGQRVQLHPATDLWMRGARFGDVVSIGRKYVKVRLDVTGKTHTISPENIGEVFAANPQI